MLECNHLIKQWANLKVTRETKSNLYIRGVTAMLVCATLTHIKLSHWNVNMCITRHTVIFWMQKIHRIKVQVKYMTAQKMRFQQLFCILYWQCLCSIPMISEIILILVLPVHFYNLQIDSNCPGTHLRLCRG